MRKAPKQYHEKFQTQIVKNEFLEEHCMGACLLREQKNSSVKKGLIIKKMMIEPFLAYS